MILTLYCNKKKWSVYFYCAFVAYSILTFFTSFLSIYNHAETPQIQCLSDCRPLFYIQIWPYTQTVYLIILCVYYCKLQVKQCMFIITPQRKLTVYHHTPHGNITLHTYMQYNLLIWKCAILHYHNVATMLLLSQNFGSYLCRHNYNVHSIVIVFSLRGPLIPLL